MSFRAHVALSGLPGAGIWLTTPPADDGRAMDASLFQIALKCRLCMPVFSNDGFCPSCGDCMDTFGDQALVCSCTGDRTVRHHALRNRFHEDVSTAGMSPEKEKAGLLPAHSL